MIDWRATDRANRVAFYSCLTLAALMIMPTFLDRISLPFMAAVLVLIYQALRLALAREVHGRIDATGIAKELGARSWRFSWDEVTAAWLMPYLGTTQLLLTTADAAGWSASDRLFGKLPRTGRALQVPADEVSAVRQLLSERGLTAA